MIDSLTGNSNRRILLLTGGSGLLGSGLIPHLRRHLPGRTIVVLARQPERMESTPGTLAVRADLTEENLGLEPEISRALRRRVTEIIHCAADVKFNSSLDSSRLVNTQGTGRMLDFAEQCPELRKFAHVSTLFVAGRRPGLLTERETHHRCGYFNAYEQSKHEAEGLVLGRMHQLPIAIYRPSAVIGNSTTGAISRKNFFHSLIALVPRAGMLPCLPIDPAAPIDLIADDWCCRALAFLFEEHFRPGAIHHLCAGAEFALTAEELVDTVFSVFEQQTGTRVAKPPMGSWIEIQERRAFPSSAKERALLDLIDPFLPHLSVNQPFDRGITGSLLESRGLTPGEPLDFVKKVIRQTLPRISSPITFAGGRIPGC